MKQIIDRLRMINHRQVVGLLDAKRDNDPQAGIIIMKLDISPIIGDDDQPYEFYAARVLPGRYVNPHYHTSGTEPYWFLSGGGEMNIGRTVNDHVIWREKTQILSNSTFLVSEGDVHSFQNPGGIQCDFLFACPATHLTEEDRFFTKELKDGLPPHYSQ